MHVLVLGLVHEHDTHRRLAQGLVVELVAHQRQRYLVVILAVALPMHFT